MLYCEVILYYKCSRITAERRTQMDAATVKSLLETTLNTRELGGIPTSGGGLTACGVFLRSDAPCRPSEADRLRLLNMGVRTVLDLRRETEINEKPNGFAEDGRFEYINIPIEAGAEIPPSVEAVPLSYLSMAEDEETMKRVFTALAESGNGVLFGCSAGKDRTGVVSALLLMLAEAADDDIAENYVITREYNRERFTLVKQNFPDIDMRIVIPTERYILEFMRLFREKYGSAEDYLNKIGACYAVKKIKEKLSGSVLRSRQTESGVVLMNPWEGIELDDYEGHMSLENVAQLQTLNSMMREQLETFSCGSVMILGAAGGNGLEHIDASVERIYAVDINHSYLARCTERFPELSDRLMTICADLTEEDCALPSSELILADLLIEYIGLESFKKAVRTVSPQRVSCVIQVNEGEGFVSTSPYSRIFDGIEEIHRDVSADALSVAMSQIGYRRAFTDSRLLPNGKSLLRLDYVRDSL